MKKISIDPITRLEGHGRIDLFLNGDGELENAYMIIPELRGFERFCEGRPVEKRNTRCIRRRPDLGAGGPARPRTLSRESRESIEPTDSIPSIPSSPFPFPSPGPSGIIRPPRAGAGLHDRGHA